MTFDKRFILLTLLAVLICGWQSGAQPHPANFKAQVKEIADAAWQESLSQSVSLRLKRQQPIEEFPDITLAQAEKDAASARALITRIDAIPRRNLDHEDALTLDIIRWEADSRVEAAKYYWL